MVIQFHSILAQTQSTGGFPSDLTTGGLLLILGWIILNQLPGILKSFGELVGTIIKARSLKTDAFEQLMQRIDKDHAYFEDERGKFNKRIEALESEVEILKKTIFEKDTVIDDLRNKLSIHGITL